MAVKKIVAPERFIQASGDTKLTDGSASVRPGATTLEYDTGDMYVTYDGTSWVKKQETTKSKLKTVSVSFLSKGVNSAAANDIISAATTGGTALAFAAIAGTDGGRGYITKATIAVKTSDAGFAPALILFNTAPGTGQLNDNYLNTSPAGTDVAAFQGVIDWAETKQYNSGYYTAVANINHLGTSNLPLAFECASDTDDLYGILLTQGAVQMGTAGSVTVSLTVEQH